MADLRADSAADSKLGQKALILVWGPPSHGPRSRVLARELDIDIRFMHVTERRGLLVAPYKYTGQALATIHCLARERPRTVLVQSPPSFAVLIVYLWAIMTGGRYVVDAHSDAMDGAIWTRPRWLHRHLARRAAATVVTNQHYADRIRSWGARALVIRDVPTTFDVGAPWPPEGQFRVAVVNSFGPDEPLEELLAAAAGLPDVRFHVTGSLRRAPKGLVEAAPANVTFTDYLPDERYYALLSSSDAVMCLTTRDHTMQRGACEALSLGTPIVTSRWPLLQEYFHDGTVHVDNDAAGIRAGVCEMHRHLSEYREGIRRLRMDQLEEWQVGSTALRSILRGEDPEPAGGPAATATRGRSLSQLKTFRRRRSEAAAARRALRHPPAVIRLGDQRSVQVLEDPRDLEALRPEWADLRADFTGPANSLTWCVAAAHVPPTGSRMCVIVLRDAGRLVAVAPLTRSSGPDGTLRFINEYDASGFLYADEDALGRLVGVVLGLRRPLVLASLVAGSATEQHLDRRLRRGPYLRWVRSWSMGPSVRIDETFAEPLMTLFSQRRSHNRSSDGGSVSTSPVSSRWVRRRVRKAEELGAVTFHVDPIGADMQVRFEEFVQIEASGWKGRKGTALAQEAAKRETLRHFLQSPDGREGLRIAAMRIDGKPVAVNLVMVAEDRLWTINDGYDEAYSRLSPGLLLLLHVLSWAVKQDLRRVELMGRMETWKRDWGEGLSLHRVRIYPWTPRGLFGLGIDAASPKRWRRVMQMLLTRIERPGARQRVRRSGSRAGGDGVVDA